MAKRKKKGQEEQEVTPLEEILTEEELEEISELESSEEDDLDPDDLDEDPDEQDLDDEEEVEDNSESDSDQDEDGEDREPVITTSDGSKYYSVDDAVKALEEKSKEIVRLRNSNNHTRNVLGGGNNRRVRQTQNDDDFDQLPEDQQIRELRKQIREQNQAMEELPGRLASQITDDRVQDVNKKARSTFSSVMPDQKLSTAANYAVARFDGGDDSFVGVNANGKVYWKSPMAPVYAMAEFAREEWGEDVAAGLLTGKLGDKGKRKRKRETVSSRKPGGNTKHKKDRQKKGGRVSAGAGGEDGQDTINVKRAAYDKDYYNSLSKAQQRTVRRLFEKLERGLIE